MLNENQWSRLSLKTQLTFVFITFALIYTLGNRISGYYAARAALIDGGFQILALQQTITLEKINPLLEPNGFSVDPATTRLTISTISKMLSDRTAFGSTGETYLTDGEGNLLTSSRFQNTPAKNLIPADIKAAVLSSGGSSPPPTKNSLQLLKKDYRGIPVLAQWNWIYTKNAEYPLLILASEIDVEEVLKPLKKNFLAISLYSLAISFASLLWVPWLASKLSKSSDLKEQITKARKVSLIEGGEVEKKQISMDLHDDIGPLFTTLAWKIDTALAKENPDLANQIQKQISEISGRIRDLSLNLSPLHIYHQFSPENWTHAIEILLDEQKIIAKQRGIALQTLIQVSLPLTSQGTLMVYRLIQEGLQNIFKHAHSKNISITLEEVQLKKQKSHFVLQIHDDGVGFQTDRSVPIEKKSGRGLLNMVSRTESLGGKITIESKPNQGTHIRIIIPANLTEYPAPSTVAQDLGPSEISKEHKNHESHT